MIVRLLTRHIGVRAEGMILAAFLWGLIGLGILTRSTSPVDYLIHTHMPLWLRVGLWWGAAVIAVVLAPSSNWSNAGLAALSIAPTIRLVSYLWAWIVDLIPGKPDGSPDGWYSAAFYVGLLAFVVLLSHISAEARAPLFGRRR